MLKFIPYASGSTGNLYEVTDGKTRILIECGLPVKEIQRLTNYQLSEFSACIVSHGHKDHSKGLNDLKKRIVDCYMGYEIFGGHICNGVDGSLICGDIVIKAFVVPHSVPCYGFIIKSGAESMVFMTDLSYCPAPFAFSPTIFALECSYAADLIPADCPREDSIFAHMSLDTCIKTLKANDLSKTREIWLLHISQSHGDPERFVREVQEVTGIPTYNAPSWKKQY